MSKTLFGKNSQTESNPLLASWEKHVKIVCSRALFESFSPASTFLRMASASLRPLGAWIGDGLQRFGENLNPPQASAGGRRQHEIRGDACPLTSAQTTMRSRTYRSRKEDLCETCNPPDGPFEDNNMGVSFTGEPLRLVLREGQKENHSFLFGRSPCVASSVQLPQWTLSAKCKPRRHVLRKQTGCKAYWVLGVYFQLLSNHKNNTVNMLRFQQPTPFGNLFSGSR